MTGAPSTTTSPSSSRWPGPSPAGRTRSSPRGSPGSPTPPPRGWTGSASSGAGRPTGSATRRTRDGGSESPAPADTADGHVSQPSLGYERLPDGNPIPVGGQSPKNRQRA